MLITDDKKLKDIQSEFNNKFPYLKLEFYSVAHEAMNGSPDVFKIYNENTIGGIRSIHNEGDLSINGHLKVSTLESNFKEKYGLNVQVYRRSYNLWIQTISTDDWTLTEQNELGAETKANENAETK